MSVNEPIKFKIFIVVTKGVNQLFSDLQQTHVEEELEDWKKSFSIMSTKELQF